MQNNPVQIPNQAGSRKDLWEKAWDFLSNSEPRLVQKYEKVLQRKCPDVTSNAASPKSSRQHQQELASIIVRRFVEQQNNPTTVQKVSQAIQTAVDQLVSVVIAGKDYISSAVSAEPHAALAWAGVCLLLPVRLSILLRVNY
jgi:hypothetical protein